MVLSWTSETADKDTPLIAHPAAHWWYTLEEEAQTTDPQTTDPQSAAARQTARILALDVGDLDQDVQQMDAQFLSPESMPSDPAPMDTTSEDATPTETAPTTAAAPSSEAPAAGMARWRRHRLRGVNRVLAPFLERARDGNAEHTLFAPVLPEGAACEGAPDPDVAAFDVPHVPADSTVIGIIDDGIAFAHPAFRMGADLAQTRFASVWQQDAAGLRGARADVPFGHVFCRAEINQRLARAAGDEDRFYRDLPRANAQQSMPFQNRNLHGTHVLDLAAGRRGTSGLGAREDADAALGDAMDQDPEKFPIVAVNLPTALVSDTAGTFMASAMILGLRDIMRRTEAMMERAGSKFPLVVNISFGLGGVGKNGGHLIAAALEHAMAYWHRRHKTPMRVILPAGNTLQSRLVAQARVSADQPHRAVVHVAPESFGSTYVEIAFSKRQRKRSMSGMRVGVTLPAGCGQVTPPPPSGPVPTETVHQLQLQRVSEDQPATGQSAAAAATDAAIEERRSLAMCGIYYGFQQDFAPDRSRSHGLGVEVVTLALPPNASKDPHRPLPPCGDWGIDICLAPGEVEPQDVEIRVLRNDVPNRAKPLRQRAWLKDPAYQAYRADGFVQTALITEGCSITRRETLNALSGGAEIVTVGASYRHKERMAEYSSAGPGGALADGAHVSLHAPAEDSPGLVGRRAAGHRGGAYQRLSGTSVAAPLVARQVLLELAKWHHAPLGSPASFAPLQSLIQRGPRNRKDHTGAGGII